MLKFDKEGKELTLAEWGKLFEDREYKIIIQTDLPNGYWVSTVWLGLCHGYDIVSPVGERCKEPLIFETMVFGGKDEKNGKYDATDLDCIRTTTENQARIDHEETVQKWSKK